MEILYFKGKNKMGLIQGFVSWIMSLVNGLLEWFTSMDALSMTFFACLFIISFYIYMEYKQGEGADPPPKDDGEDDWRLRFVK